MDLNRRLPAYLLAFCCLLLILSGSATAQTDANARTEAFIQSAMRSEHIPGLAVAVMKGSKVMLVKGYGYANLELQAKTSTKTMFGIASVTKSFTAIAIMMLVEEKKVSLNEPIGTYLPDLPTNWKPVTVRQLLNHTSGISSFSKHEKIPCPVGKDVREYVRGDAWKEVACLPLDFKPGEGWAYGDTNYYLLGLIIEKVSKKRYEEFMKARVYSALGMPTTRLMSYKDLIPGRADGYDFNTKGYTLAPRFEVDEFSNGGIVSNVEEMIRLHVAFTSERLLKKATWNEMWTPTVLNNGKNIPQYGLGFGLTPYEGRKRIGHNGGGGLGFSTASSHFPDESLTVVLLTNVNLPEGRSGAMANTIASFYFNKR